MLGFDMGSSQNEGPISVPLKFWCREIIDWVSRRTKLSGHSICILIAGQNVVVRAGYGFVPAIHPSGAMNHHSAACCVSGSPGGVGVNLRTIIAVYVRIVARIRSPTFPYATDSKSFEYCGCGTEVSCSSSPLFRQLLTALQWSLHKKTQLT